MKHDPQILLIFEAKEQSVPVNKYAMIRFRVIDKKLRNKQRPYPTLEDLLEACEDTLGKQLSKSTIEKDIAAMKFDGSLGFEAPIKFSRRYRGYYYDDPDYTINEVPLNDDEVEAIRFAAETLHQFKEIGIFKQYESAIDKILDRVNISQEFEGTADEFVQFERLPTISGNEFLGILLQAIKDRKKVQFDYQSFKKQNKSRRTVHPYLLKEHSNRWYLICWSEQRETIVVFGLDRMEDLEVVDERYEVTENFSADQFFRYSLGITADTSQEPQKIVLHCNAVLGKYLKSQPIHASQKVIKDTDSECVIELYVIETYELIEKILSFGLQAEVLEPLSLRDKIKKQLESTLLKYN